MTSHLSGLEAQSGTPRLLDWHENALLEEIASQQKGALENVRTAFRQLITLNTGVIGLQIALVKASGPVEKLAALAQALLVLSFLALFGSMGLSVFGQLYKPLELSTLDLLEAYREARDSALRRGYGIYRVAIVLFVGGLLAFALTVTGWFVW